MALLHIFEKGLARAPQIYNRYVNDTAKTVENPKAICALHLPHHPLHPTSTVIQAMPPSPKAQNDQQKTLELEGLPLSSKVW